MVPLYSLSLSSGVPVQEETWDPGTGPAAIPSCVDSFSTAWRALHHLRQRLTTCRDAHCAVQLDRADHRFMAKMLDAIDPHALPADSRELLVRWQHLAACQAAEPDQYRVFTHLEQPSLRELIQLLSDVQAVNCRATRGGWRPANSREAQDQRHLLNWMNASRPMRESGPHARTEALQRLVAGRQLLYQAAGLSTDLCLGSDQTPPRLPEAALLRDLLAPTTRAHVVLPADAAAVPGLLDLLLLLPVRTWRLQDLRTLDALLQSDPPAVRSLDLSGLSAPLRPEARALLNRAIEQLHNLHAVRLPAGTPGNVLPSSWRSADDSRGVVFLRTGRPDGLTLLDDAVKAWGGAPFTTAMPIARIASDPDAAALLHWTALAGHACAHTPEGAGLGRAVLRMLNGAAASPLRLQCLADALRQAPPGPDASPAHFTVSLAAALLSELKLGVPVTGPGDRRPLRPDPAMARKE